MDRRKFLGAAGAAGALIWATPTVASAVTPRGGGSPPPVEPPGCDARGVIFSDGFEGDAQALNQTTFVNWQVSDGTVDVIGGNGGTVVDLDGSSNNSGLFELKAASQPTKTVGMEYTLDFVAYANGGNTFTVAFGEAPPIVLAGGSGSFTPQQVTFVAASAGAIALSFQDSGNDNVGTYIDNVSITESCPLTG